MAYFNGVLDRQITGKLANRRPYYKHFTTEAKHAGVITASPEGIENPPFACKFGQGSSTGHLLALVDEEGYLSIVDTAMTLPQTLAQEEAWGAHQPAKQLWMAHRNAVFDVCWIKDGSLILTASGDQSIGLWDCNHPRAVARYQGHTGSVKSLDCHPRQTDVFASGSRDGSVLVWDMRTPVSSTDSNGVSIRSAVLCVSRAQSGMPFHRRCSAHAGARSHRPGAAGRARGIPEPRTSVTAVKFLRNGYSLLSGGASDDVVRYWDIRLAGSPLLHIQPEPPEIPCLAATSSHSQAGGHHWGRQYGVTSIVEDPQGARIVVSYVNNVHSCYSSNHPHCGPLYTFGSSMLGSFYVKTAISPDGNHLLAGSSDCTARIWQIDRPDLGPYLLEGHESEVTCVAWSAENECKVATCGDDCTARVWLVSMPTPASKSPRCHTPGAEATMRPPAQQQSVAPAAASKRQQDAHQSGTRDSPVHQDSSHNGDGGKPSEVPQQVAARSTSSASLPKPTSTTTPATASTAAQGVFGCRRATPPPSSIQRSLLEFMTTAARPPSSGLLVPSEAQTVLNRSTVAQQTVVLPNRKKRKLMQIRSDENKPPN